MSIQRTIMYGILNLGVFETRAKLFSVYTSDMYTLLSPRGLEILGLDCIH